MVAIQVILVGAFVLLLIRFVTNPVGYQTRALTKIFMILFTFIAITVIIFPNMANTFAHWVGVGRGADLLLYIVSLSFIFTVLNGYVRGKKVEQRMTILAREVALLKAQQQRQK